MQSVRRFGRTLLAVPLLFAGATCTSLTEVPHDALTPDNAFKTDAELLAGIAGVYANLRAMEWVGYITLQDLTTDVSIVPTRGSDWYDNGRWLEIHRQTWAANSGSALDDMNGAWNNMFSGIAKANLMIGVVTNAAPPNAATTLAELRTLRAWYYYMLMDMFGGAPPLVTKDSLGKFPSSTRTALYTFIKDELTAAVADLPATRPSTEYGRVTKSAANAILASLYLNSGVFNKNTGVSATSYNACAAADCTAAITAADAVINSGNYSLAPAGQWNRSFNTTNTAAPENIFVIVYTAESQGLGGCWPWRTLHYNQLNSGGGPWNGFATLAETYAAFTPTDERRGMWLAGQGYSFDTGLPVNDRTGAPLIFTTAIPDANQANEANGVRFNKFPPLPSATGGCGMPNDFPFYRISEMYLIKAEAQNELGSTAAAITTLKLVHDLRDPANPIAAGLTQTQVRAAILKERLLEFAGEGKRRTDMVRHGRFLEDWSTGTGCATNTAPCSMLNGKRSRLSATHLILFPVPVTQIGSNPNLVQNPGY